MPLSLSARLGTAAIVSTLSLLPFAILDRLNRDSLVAGFPFVLFAVLWVLPFVFVLLGGGLLRPGPGGHPRRSWRFVAAAGLIFIAWLWSGIVIDQMPCFLGVPNCD